MKTREKRQLKYAFVGLTLKEKLKGSGVKKPIKASNVLNEIKKMALICIY